MSFFAKLFRRKPAQIDSVEEVKPLEEVIENLPTPEVPQEESVEDIWSMDDDDTDEVEAATPAPAANRRRRNATRILGFQALEDDEADPFEQEPTEVASATTMYPAGWITIIEGEGRGNAFMLAQGLNQVGRGEENSIQLDFGDTAISRQNHFSLVYDEEEKKFYLGHGGKSNIVRLNEKPVISNEPITNGDRIKVGNTIMIVTTLCGEAFDWNDEEEDGGNDDLAIA